MDGNKKRMSISLPTDLEHEIVELRKTERFCRASYAEIIRTVLVLGLQSMNDSYKTQNDAEAV